MAIDVPLPSYSENMEGADVIGWLVAPGDHVNEGDPIAEIETDKATGELESPVSGVLLEICVAEGTPDVKVGTVVARIEPSEATADASDPPAETTSASPPSPPAEPDSADAPAPPEANPLPAAESDEATEAERDVEETVQSKPGIPGEPLASPETVPPANDDTQESSTPTVAATALARRLAGQQGVDLQTLTGTGLRGRITKADVEAAHAGGESVASPGVMDSGTVATLETPCSIARAQEVCGQLAQREGLEEFPLAAVFIRSAAMANEEVPEVLGATQAPDGDHAICLEQASGDAAGSTALRVSIVEGAQRKSLAVISQALESGTGDTRPEGPATTAGDFRMIDLGCLEIERVQAPLEAPSVACLALGAPAPRLIPDDGPGGGGRFVPFVHCSLTVDTRAVSVHAAARWLQNFRRRVEDPLEMLL